MFFGNLVGDPVVSVGVSVFGFGFGWPGM